VSISNQMWPGMPPPRLCARPRCACRGLHDAASSGDLAAVKQCLEQGVDVNIICRARATGHFTALMEAADYGYPRVCKALLDARACPTTVCKTRRWTALTWACSAVRIGSRDLTAGHLAAVDTLLSRHHHHHQGGGEPISCVRDIVRTGLGTLTENCLSVPHPGPVHDCPPLQAWEIDQALGAACFMADGELCAQRWPMRAALVQRLLNHGGVVLPSTLIDASVGRLMDAHYRRQRRLTTEALQVATPVRCSPLIALVVAYLLNAHQVMPKP